MARWNRRGVLREGASSLAAWSFAGVMGPRGVVRGSGVLPDYPPVPSKQYPSPQSPPPPLTTYRCPIFESTIYNGVHYYVTYVCNNPPNNPTTIQSVSPIRTCWCTLNPTSPPCNTCTAVTFAARLAGADGHQVDDSAKRRGLDNNLPPDRPFPARFRGPDGQPYMTVAHVEGWPADYDIQLPGESRARAVRLFRIEIRPDRPGDGLEGLTLNIGQQLAVKVKPGQGSAQIAGDVEGHYVPMKVDDPSAGDCTFHCLLRNRPPDQA